MASALPPLYAHRLGRHYGPDSSAAALRHTLTGPVEGLETDVCLTSDDRLVLLHRRGTLQAAPGGASPRPSRGDQLSWRGVHCRLRKRDPVSSRDLGRLRARSARFLGSPERCRRDLGRALPALRAIGRGASGRRAERQRGNCEPSRAPKPGARVRSRCDRHRSPSRASRRGRNSHRAGDAAALRSRMTLEWGALELMSELGVRESSG